MENNIHTEDTLLPFRGACALIKDGNSSVVQTLLAQDTYTVLEQTYLRAWLYCEVARSSNDINDDERDHAWDTAASVFLEVRTELEEKVAGASDYFQKRSGSIRRCRPWTLWLLGKLAGHLECPEPGHYARALLFLDERRMNILWLRVMILCDQADELRQSKLYKAALVQFQTALFLCNEALTKGEKTQHIALLPPILAGLATTQAQMGGDLEEAVRWGKEALQLQTDALAKARTLHLLGGIYTQQKRSADARVAYTDALQLANDDAVMQARCMVALAELRLKEHDIAGARADCQLALQRERELPKTVLASLYQTCGRVAHAQTTCTSDKEQILPLYEEAVSWCVKAVQASPTGGSAYVLGTILEEIIRYDSQQAQTPFWRDAYHLLIKGIAVC